MVVLSSGMEQCKERDTMKEFIKNLSDQDTEEKVTFLSELKSRCEAVLSPLCQVFSDYADRKTYSHDLASIPPFLEKMLFRTTPLLVIQPHTPEDIKNILTLAGEYSLPVFPRGIASWGLGGAVPTSNGIVIDFSPMDAVAIPDSNELTVTVQAGARWGVIDERLAQEKLTLAVTPSSRFSTVGGWIATGGYGLGSLGHGHLSRWVKEICVATPGRGLATIGEKDEDFPLFFNTEGQLGLIYEATLRVIPRPDRDYPHLVTFENDGDAFEFAQALLDTSLVPETMDFKGENHIKELNRLWKEPLFAEKPTLLLNFISRPEEERFREACRNHDEAAPHLARLLWQERYSPLKMHTAAPSILASEVILPLGRAGAYIEKAKRLAKNFNATLYFEFHFIREEENNEVLAMCLFNCDRRKMLAYYAYLSLVPALTHLGIKLGGRPYGIGIWNVPFFAAAFPGELRKKIIEGKKKYDPSGIMNPRKFTAIRSRFFDLPAKIFNPLFFSIGMELVSVFSPALRAFLPSLKGELKIGGNVMEESAFSCTGCGNCLTMCPAYRVTRKESCSPRGKLSLARRYIHRKKLSQEAIQEAFYCTRCRNCEHICQSKIHHIDVWEEFEGKLRKIAPVDEKKIEAFVDSLPEHQEYLDLIGFKQWVNL
jgi:FAD/FMN-containing dehydrogenase